MIYTINKLIKNLKFLNYTRILIIFFISLASTIYIHYNNTLWLLYILIYIDIFYYVSNEGKQKTLISAIDLNGLDSNKHNAKIINTIIDNLNKMFIKCTHKMKTNCISYCSMYTYDSHYFDDSNYISVKLIDDKLFSNFKEDNMYNIKFYLFNKLITTYDQVFSILGKYIIDKLNMNKQGYFFIFEQNEDICDLMIYTYFDKNIDKVKAILQKGDIYMVNNNI